MKKWQIENSEKSEISEILEILFRVLLFPSFRFCLPAKNENLDLKILKKNFRDFRDFQGFQVFDLASVTCFSETWASEENINKNSTFQLKNYNVIHQVRNSRKGGALYIFIHESLCYKLRKDLSVNSEAIESLSIEIFNKKASNLIFSAIYRHI